MWFAILGVSLVIIICIIILVKLGFIEKKNVTIEDLGPYLLIYKESLGEFDEHSEKCLIDLEAKLLSHKFHFQQQIKITYDNFEALKNPEDVRFIFGFIIDDAENKLTMERALTFCEIYQTYNFAILPQSLAVTASYTKGQKRLNRLYLHNKLYPQMITELLKNFKSSRNKDGVAPEVIGVIEVEKRPNNEKKVFVYIPFGEDSRKYLLTSFPEPEYNPLIKVKKD